jgi:hypothetical protein
MLGWLAALTYAAALHVVDMQALDVQDKRGTIT